MVENQTVDRTKHRQSGGICCFYVFFKMDIALRTLSLSWQSSGRRASHYVIGNVPDRLFELHLIQSETVAVCRTMFNDICGSMEKGAAVLGLFDPNDLSYRKARIKWGKVMSSDSKDIEVVGIAEPVCKEEDALSQQERKELSDLRSRSEAQINYFKRLIEYQEQLRRFRHDRKNNLIALSALINSGDIEGAKVYLAGISAELTQMTPVINTGNMAIDALVSEKIQEAYSAGIKIDQMVGLSVKPKINMKDLCVAVGCALDNGIEACRNAKEKYLETYIMFRLIEKHGVITFTMENTSITPVQLGNGFPETSKEDKLNHGFGLKNIALIVEKYNGYLELIPEDGKFTTKFTLFSKQ